MEGRRTQSVSNKVLKYFFNEHFNHHLILNTHNQLMRINMIYNTQGNFYQNN